MFDHEFGFSIVCSCACAVAFDRTSLVLYITVRRACFRTWRSWSPPPCWGTAGWSAGLLLMIATLLLLVFAVTALSLGMAFALPGHIELIAVIFVANLPLLASRLWPLFPSCRPGWAGRPGSPPSIEPCVRWRASSISAVLPRRLWRSPASPVSRSAGAHKSDDLPIRPLLNRKLS